MRENIIDRYIIFHKFHACFNAGRQSDANYLLVYENIHAHIRKSYKIDHCL